MLKKLYIKSKNNVSTIYKNTITFPILVNIKNGISIYIYYIYIKSNQTTLSQSNLTYKESYSIYMKKTKMFNLINTYFPTFYIKDNLLYKTFLIKYNFLDLNYLYSKNILLPKNVISQIIHRQFINNSTILLFNNKFLINNSLNIYSLYKNYMYITTYYTY